MESPMDVRLQGIIRRYTAYNWKTRFIIALIQRRFDAPIRSKCVRNIRDNISCSPKCAETCPIRQVERWYTPDFDSIKT